MQIHLIRHILEDHSTAIIAKDKSIVVLYVLAIKLLITFLSS